MPLNLVMFEQVPEVAARGNLFADFILPNRENF
jgi:hypothetical protein